MERKRIFSALIILLLLSSVAAAAIATSWSASAGTDFLTSTGVEVSLLGDEEIESGDLFTSSSVTLQNVTFHGNNATIAMYPGYWNGTWTNVTAMNVLNGNVTINPQDKNELSFAGGITAVNFTNINTNDTAIDFIYSSTSGGTIIVPNTTAGQQWGMINPFNNVGLDVAIANATGYTHFDEVPVKTSQAVTIQPLGILYIREETPEPHNIINTTSVTLKFYEDIDFHEFDQGVNIITKTTSNGQIDLTGLPVTSEFVVISQAVGYHPRTTLIGNLGFQNTIFLLNKTQPSTNTHIQIVDYTGSYSPDSDISFVIKKPINVTSYDPGNVTFQGLSTYLTMSGDHLGNPQVFNATLNTLERYNIEVSNSAGDVRSLGGFVPTAERPTTNPLIIEIKTTDAKLSVAPGSSWNATVDDSDLANQVIRLRYDDPDQRTSNFTWYVTLYGNDTRIWTSPQFCNPVDCGNITASEGLSGTIGPALMNRTLSVHVQFWRQFAQAGVINGTGQSVFSDYTKVTENRLINKQGILSGVIPMDEFWLNTIAIAFLVLTTAGAGAMTNKGFAGVIIVAVAYTLGIFGWMPPEINPLSYGFAMVLAVLYWFGTSRTKGN
tara:strand:+ start:14095 stop:15915 length:1821 start_codon:yes stop_codon:yes gene_type:complete